MSTHLNLFLDSPTSLTIFAVKNWHFPMTWLKRFAIACVRHESCSLLYMGMIYYAFLLTWSTWTLNTLLSSNPPNYWPKRYWYTSRCINCFWLDGASAIRYWLANLWKQNEMYLFIEFSNIFKIKRPSIHTIQSGWSYLSMWTNLVLFLREERCKYERREIRRSSYINQSRARGHLGL